MKVLTTEKAPGAIGPYSQGMETAHMVFTSGQIPVDPISGSIPEGILAQAEQSCQNVGAVLAAAGLNFVNVVKTTCFLPVWKISRRSTRFTPSILSLSRLVAA